MTDQPDHDSPTHLPIDDLGVPTAPLETVRERAGPGDISLLGGGLALLAAVRAAQRGQLRTIPLGLAGGWLLRHGLSTRRGTDEALTFEPTSDAGAEKSVSDQAAAANERGEPIHVDEPAAGDEGGSRIEFTEPGDREVSQSTPDLETEADPRRTTPDEDAEAEIDLSESATAEEASEAAGPSPEQSQPTQTDTTEPEETPAEDASELAIDPDEDDEETNEHNRDTES